MQDPIVRCSAELGIEADLSGTTNPYYKLDRNGEHSGVAEGKDSKMRPGDAGNPYIEKYLDAAVGDRHPSCSPSDPYGHDPALNLD